VDALDLTVDVVVVFCAPTEVAEVAQTLAGAPVAAVWFQEGLIDPTAARRLEAAGKVVIMDRCVMRDYRRQVLGEEVESWFPV
jgi:predicted CoA-binding protein